MKILIVAAKRPCHNDHCHQSGFDEGWKKKHPYNSEEKAMYCELCIKYNMLPRNGNGKWATTDLFPFGMTSSYSMKSSHRDAKRARIDEAHAIARGRGHSNSIRRSL